MILLAAYLTDRMIGDPRAIPHPVVWMGKVIVWLEHGIRRHVRRESRLKWAGMLLPLLLAGGSYGIVELLLALAEMIHPWLARALEVGLIASTIAVKGLAEAGIGIYQRLADSRLPEARKALSMVVGRDTEQLDEREVARGAIETVAENIVDAIVSPLFYAAIGGAPLAMAYRAVNTLDSMVGYKNERYRNLGWASARLDDAANYLPARLAAMFLVAASWTMGLNWRHAWTIIRRDARLHPSPNSGWTEAGTAGALSIQLGGTNYYQGIPSLRAKLGEPLRQIDAHDIQVTVDLMKRTSWMFLAVCLIGMTAFG
jgi:adenosylcobinamide-phosphate synthase